MSVDCPAGTPRVMAARKRGWLLSSAAARLVQGAMTRLPWRTRHRAALSGGMAAALGVAP